MLKINIIDKVLNFKQGDIIAVLHCKNNDYVTLIYKIVLEASKNELPVLILDCSYSFREKVLQNLCKQFRIDFESLKSYLRKVPIREEKQFLDILHQIYHKELTYDFKILILLHISFLLEKFYKKLKEREQTIKDAYSVIPLLKSPDRIVLIVEKMLEGFYPTECIAREEIERIADQKIYFLPYKTININGAKITYQQI
ncbi:MAG: hypothetical protein ACTSYM_04305 [Candidatus Baldrarchaeia archaeon]